MKNRLSVGFCVNKEVCDAMNKQAHLDDLNLHVIHYLATDVIPLVQMADMLVNKKELEPQNC